LPLSANGLVADDPATACELEGLGITLGLFAELILGLSAAGGEFELPCEDLSEARPGGVPIPTDGLPSCGTSADLGLLGCEALASLISSDAFGGLGAERLELP